MARIPLTFHWGGSNVVARDASGAAVGYMKINLKGSNGPYVEDVTVAPNARRQGVATALYAEAETKLGKPLDPSHILSEDGLNFWKKFRPSEVQGRHASVPSGTLSPEQERSWFDAEIKDLERRYRSKVRAIRPEDLI